MPTPPLHVRAATAADIPALLDLIHSAYRGEASRAGWTTEADLLGGSRTTAGLLGAELADEAVRFLVAEDGDGLVGCCAVTDRGNGTAYFGTFAVRPAAQGAGIGTRLLAAAEVHARAAGAVRMEMSVLTQRSELLAWYARRNYAPTGRKLPFPYGDERYGVPRREDLEFTVISAPLDPPEGHPTVLRVAIVDDSAEIRALWRAALRAGGAFEVCAEGADGREAVDIAARLAPDVLLLDLSMPDMGGMQALPLIREAAPRTRVVVLSAFGRRRYEQKARELGAAGFLEKHHPVDTLCRRLLEILGRAEGAPSDGEEHPSFGPW